MLPGAGLLFAGMGAVTTGLATHMGYCVGVISQFTWFFVATSAWALFLWRPLKLLQQGSASGYTDVIGALAVVADEGIERGKTGKVIWSGAIMNAVLALDCEENRVSKGASVRIVDVSKGVLVVTVDAKKEG